MNASQQNNALLTLLRKMEHVRAVDPEMPAQTLCSLLLISSKPGRMISEISKELGIAVSSATRNVFSLAKWKTPGTPGLDLVRAEEDEQDRRIKRLYLTAKGERFVQQLTEID